MIEIKDLQPRMGKVEIVVTIKDIQEPKEFDRFGKITKVANATGFDETGSVKMSLWNEDIDRIKEGTKVLIKNGYVSEWQGEMQLGTGKYGTMEIAGQVENLADKEVVEEKLENEEAPEEKVEPVEEVVEEPKEETVEKPSEEDIEY